MQESLKILMLEDSIVDAEIIQRLLLKKKPHCEIKLVMTKEAYLEALDQFRPDVILSDNTLPQFNATEALELLNQRALHIPFILVTGTVSEEFAANIIKLGADDYILKDRLTRLPGAIVAALKQRRAENEKLEAQKKLAQSEEKYRLLFERNLAGICQTTIEGRILSCNDSFAHILGYASHRDLEQKNSNIFYFSDAARDTFLNDLNTKRQLSNYEAVLKHRDGREVYIIENISLHRDTKNGEDIIEGVIIDITERKKAEKNLISLEKKILEQKIQEQKKIARAIIKAQEKERNYIGQELHDNINQILAGTKIYLSVAGKSNEAVKEIIKYPMELIDSSIEEIRLLGRRLVTPIINIDLEELVRDLLNNINQNTITKTDFIYDVSNVCVSDDLKLNVYRIIQEQINNILKHADAKNVTISIKEQDKGIGIVISDDGKGFDVNKKRKGIGISNMINRIESYNGKVEIKSSIGNGCIISVKVPVN